jgi:hypothetical protein
MTDERLLARLRGRGIKDTIAAADRIEALTAERDMATEGWAEATRLIDVARQQYGAEKSRAEAAEAKLAKVVEKSNAMLDAFCVHETQQQVEAYDSMCATLAEIEGEK